MAWSDLTITSSGYFSSTLRTAAYVYQKTVATWQNTYSTPYEVSQIKFTACTYNASWTSGSNTYPASTSAITGLYFTARPYYMSGSTKVYDSDYSSAISTGTITLAKSSSTSTYTLTFASNITVLNGYYLEINLYFPSTYNSTSYSIKTSGTFSTTMQINSAPATCVYVYNNSAWKRAVPYIYNGSTWVPASAYIYNGSDWKLSIV